MKQFNLLMLAFAMGCSGAMAQSVVVVLKDGTHQKFGSDYVKEIVFTEESEPQKPVSLLLSKTEVYSQGNVVLSFSPIDESCNVVLDMYGNYDDTYLKPGTYNVSAPQTPFSVGNDEKYSYVDFVESGKGRVGFQSGAAVVTMNEETFVYTIDMDFTLTDGSQFKGVFEGEIPDYSPNKDNGINITLSDAKYNENPQKPGEFYVNFNDQAWSCAMAIDFMSKADATVLPAGTYTYSANGGEMTFSSKSYLEIYTPYSNNRFTGGTITVAEDNGDYTMVMDLTLEDGRKANITYAGKIAGTPTFEQPADIVEFSLANKNVYGQGNVSLTFKAADDSELALDVYGPTAAQFLETGTYEVKAGGTPFSIGDGIQYTYFKKADGQPVGITSGTAAVSIGENYVYTIVMDFTLADGSKLNGEFKGAIPYYNPHIDTTLSAASYNENKQNPGEFYVKFNDTNWSCEMAIDFMSKADATVLPAGTYTYSADGGEMTFSSKSYLDLYNPYPSSNNRFKTGTITVTEEGGNYNLAMDLTLEDGRTANLTYSGTISGTPTFE